MRQVQHVSGLVRGQTEVTRRNATRRNLVGPVRVVLIVLSGCPVRITLHPPQRAVHRPGQLPGQLPVRGSQGRAAWDSWCIQGLIKAPGRRPKPSNCMHACGSKQPDDGQGGGGEEERKGGDFLAQPRQSVKLHTSLLPVLDSPPPSLPPPSRECWLPTTRPQDCHFGKENEALHPCCPSSLLLPLVNLLCTYLPPSPSPSSSRLSPP